jgi:4-hydroxy-4-methyl-2-oxoglutarate aldolase
VVSAPDTKTQTRRDGADLRLVERLGALYVGVVADCLDAAGVRNNVMATTIRPLDPEVAVAGYAATFQLAATETTPEKPADYYAGEIAAVESVQPGDVIVASTLDRSFWGELLATATEALGGLGIVADAYTRDTAALLKMGFPTYVAGTEASDALGRVEVVDHGIPVRCGGVLVHPADLVLADRDGVVVLPSDVAEEVIAAAEKKASEENQVRAALREGTSLSVAFATYGIL